MFSPVSVEEIAFGMALFVDAANRPAAPSNEFARKDRREGEHLFLALSFGMHESVDEQKRTSLLQTHLARAFFVLWRHYQGDERRPSICARIIGFCYLMEKTRGALVEQWSCEDPDGSEHVLLNPAIIEALANVPLSDKGGLSQGALHRQIQRFVEHRTRGIDSGKPSGTWPSSSSEVGTLMRKRDWSSSPLRTVEHWPAALRTSIDLALGCAFPMVVLWGSDLRQFYNDAYRDIMGAKHPAGLGQPTHECWPEVWRINEPIYGRVQRGETLTFENQLYPIIRYGFLEDAYFTLCYSPVRDERLQSKVFW